eukprot:3742523-Prymnesium_polylepis.2
MYHFNDVYETFTTPCTPRVTFAKCFQAKIAVSRIAAEHQGKCHELYTAYGDCREALNCVGTACLDTTATGWQMIYVETADLTGTLYQNPALLDGDGGQGANAASATFQLVEPGSYT